MNCDFYFCHPYASCEKGTNEKHNSIIRYFIPKSDLIENYSNEDIRNAFIEFKSFPCPFSDCNHTNEEECLVKKAVKDNNILESRYLNYLSFIKEDKK